MHSTSNANGMCTVERHRSALGFAQIKSEVYDRFKSYVICRHAGYVPLILGGRLGSSEFVHKGWAGVSSSAFSTPWLERGSEKPYSY